MQLRTIIFCIIPKHDFYGPRSLAKQADNALETTPDNEKEKSKPTDMKGSIHVLKLVLFWNKWVMRMNGNEISYIECITEPTCANA